MFQIITSHLSKITKYSAWYHQNATTSINRAVQMNDAKGGILPYCGRKIHRLLFAEWTGKKPIFPHSRIGYYNTQRTFTHLAFVITTSLTKRKLIKSMPQSVHWPNEIVEFGNSPSLPLERPALYFPITPWRRNTQVSAITSTTGKAFDSFVELHSTFYLHPTPEPSFVLSK